MFHYLVLIFLILFLQSAQGKDFRNLAGEPDLDGLLRQFHSNCKSAKSFDGRRGAFVGLQKKVVQQERVLFDKAVKDKALEKKYENFSSVSTYLGLLDPKLIILKNCDYLARVQMSAYSPQEWITELSNTSIGFRVALESLSCLCGKDYLNTENFRPKNQ